MNYGRTLVIPDVHGDITKIRDAMLKWKPSKVITLGDLFDGPKSTKSNVKQITRWLCQNMRNDNVIPIMGNHDLHYLYDYPWFRSMGYKVSTKKYINETLKNNNFSIYNLRRKFKLFHIHVAERPYYSRKKITVLSHAGVQNYHFAWIKDFPALSKLSSANIETYEEGFRHIEDHFELSMTAGVRHPLAFCGKARGGDDKWSGPLWLHWSVFTPVPNIDQLVGHTTLTLFQSKMGSNSTNYCLDTTGDWVALFSSRHNEPEFSIRRIYGDKSDTYATSHHTEASVEPF